MKRFFGNRWVALILAALLVIGASLWGLRSSLNRRAGRLEQAFRTTSGEKGPGNYLDEADDCAACLVTVGRKYDPAAADALAQARTDLREAAENKGRYRAFLVLRERADALERSLQQKSLTEKDRSYLQKYTAQLKTAADRTELAAWEYNEQVRDYQALLDSFPASLFRRLLGVKEVHEFG